MESHGLPALLGNQALFTFAVDGCDEELRVVRFRGQEGISTLFEFRLELAASTLPLDALVGRPAVLTIDGVQATRHVRGIVCEAGYVGESARYTLYEVTLVPAIWRLQQRAASRIFQKLSTPQILAKTLEAAGIPRADFRLDLRAEYAPRDYCVQYRETDLDFLRRLMEDAGIYYYFEHAEDRHVLVMTDRADGGAPIAGDPTLHFHDAGGGEHVSRFRLSEGLRPQRVSLRDKNLHRPDEPMEASEGAGTEREIYDHPGGFQELGKAGPHAGGQQARLRLESLQASRRRGEGASDSPRLTPGFVFTLDDAARGHLAGDYRIVRVVHRGEQPQTLAEGTTTGVMYSNEFECTDKKIPYRAPRVAPRPLVHGAQTATVVGPAGEEVHVDEHGRVKVQFHWDRHGRLDESSSCWVRVSQAWAGSGFGAMFIPRIGHEVIVDFLEGDPDRPIITGRVYTGTNVTPYPLPEAWTKSTIKSESTPGGGGSNELRFDDARGNEEIYLHGQRDWNIVVERDKSQQIGHDHTASIGSNMTIAIGSELTETVGADARHTIGAHKTETVALTSTLSVGAEYQVGVGAAMHETVGLARTERVGGNKAVVVGDDSSERVGGGKSVSAAGNITDSAGKNITLSAGNHVNVTAGQNLNVSTGKSAQVVVADKLTLQCPAATVVVKKNGDVSIRAARLKVSASGDITIKGSKVKIN